MNSVILGVGATTPAGATAAETWRLLAEGYSAPRVPAPQPLGKRNYLYCAVPEKFVRTVGRQARLRRSGVLSLFGAAAALDALSDAQVEVNAEFGAHCALIYSVSSGGVQYTRRFYHEIVTQGASSASPLLFPETVFNAPASHLAALLGLNGKTYTLVGDSAVGVSAIQFGNEILALDPEVEHVLVVGTEEVDWLLPDAFAAWRLTSKDGQCEVYGARTGLVFGEGAGAVLLARQGQGPVIARAHPGQTFFSRQDSRQIALEVLDSVLGTDQPDAIIASANGTDADAVEQATFTRLNLVAPVYAHKPALGEALGAGAVLQTVFATLALRHQCLPGTLCAGGRYPFVNRQTRSFTLDRVLVTAIGFNQQVGALLLERTGL
jgi:3-oxoacyl-(acyl-carrier-protein) synthase